MLFLRDYKRVSTKDGGEYAGPCWFTGEGEDRFRIFPHHPRYDKPVWFCRGGCGSCPGKTSSDGCYKYGFIEDEDERAEIVQTYKKVGSERRTPVPTIKQAEGYQKLLDGETLSYLSSRGISEKVARKHQLGKRHNKMVTIPNIATINGVPTSFGVKWRWLPRYQPPDTEAYRMLPGSKAKSIYNFDVLSRHWPYVVIVEAVLDVLMLESLKIPAVAPFGGGGIWGDWGKFFDCDVIINIADNDPDQVKPNGEIWNPGLKYADVRAYMLGLTDNPSFSRIVTCLPPEPWDDVTSAHQNDVDVREYMENLVKGEHQTWELPFISIPTGQSKQLMTTV
jgi:hypothetical protein